MKNEDKLLELASEKFGELTDAEKKLFKATANGELADYSAEKEEDNDPAGAKDWDDSRTLKADRIAWLCTDKQASELVTHKGIKIKGARIDGELDLAFARISFPFYLWICFIPEKMNLRHCELHALYLIGTHTRAIFADGIKVTGDVFLRDGFKSEGEVRLLGAEIGRNLECSSGHFINPEGKSLNADGLKVTGDVFLSEKFKSEGEVRLPGAEVGGDLACISGQFINLKPEGKSLNADGLKVGGYVFLRDGFKSEGEVCLLGAEIEGNLECSSGQFINPEGQSLSADRLKVKRSVFLRAKFKSEGEVRLLGAEIGGILDCSSGQFINLKGCSITAELLKVEGDAYFTKGFESQGNVNLNGAVIDGFFIWIDLKSPSKTRLDLRSGRIGTLWDDKQSWPDKGKIPLDGFVYNAIYEHAPLDPESRIEWLRRQPEGRFYPQPYEQLAEVYNKSGRSEDAKKVLIAKNEDPERIKKLTRWQKAWHHIMRLSIGYGHRPSRAFKWVVGIILFGWVLFWWGNNANLITPTKNDAYVESKVHGFDIKVLSDDYPKLSPLMYSVDMFVPLVNLHQAEYWMPNANKGRTVIPLSWCKLTTGGALRIWMWIQIIAGWMLSTLLVISLSGLIKN